MAVITVTQKDLVMNKTLDAQWVTAKITKVELKRAASGKSNNYYITYVLDENSAAPGKEITRVINDTRGNGDLYPIFAAVRGVPLSEFAVGDSLDTDELVNAELDIHVFPDVYDGQKIQGINGWLPAGAGSNEVAF